MLSAVCVFCGSRTGRRPEYSSIAAELGKALAELNIRLVYGGGNVGVMGILADAVLETGGDVTGVIPEALLQRELAHDGVQDMRIVDSMHTRKALMAKLSQAFVALPGGLGTFEELCEILTWRQLHFHDQPIAVLNVGGYFDPFLTMLDYCVEEEFLTSKNRNLLRSVETVAELMDFLQSAPSPDTADPSTIDELT